MNDLIFSGVPLTLMDFLPEPWESKDSSVPFITILPLLTMIASLQTFSTSCRMWDETSTDLSDAAMRAIRSSISSRPFGSIPLVGSSRNRMSGSWTMAWASLTLCFMPVEYEPTGRYRSSPMPTKSRTSWLRGIESALVIPESRPM